MWEILKLIRFVLSSKNKTIVFHFLFSLFCTLNFLDIFLSFFQRLSKVLEVFFYFLSILSFEFNYFFPFSSQKQPPPSNLLSKKNKNYERRQLTCRRCGCCWLTKVKSSTEAAMKIDFLVCFLGKMKSSTSRV